jgi:hypothetical protein
MNMDEDDGFSATYTALMDQISTLNAIASATTDPQIISHLKRQVHAIRQRLLASIIAMQTL